MNTINVKDIKISRIKSTDLPAILAIEKASFPSPWEDKDFRHTLSSKGNIGFVAEINNEVVGYSIYRIEKDHESSINHLSIISIAVAPHLRRNKIGFMLVLGKDGVAQLNCKKICVTVSDDNLSAHLFFRALSFEAEPKISKNFFGPGTDGYNFVYRSDDSCKVNKHKQLDKSCQGK